MATTGKNIHDAERDWYSKRAGFTFQPNTPITEMKRAYYASVVGGGAQENLNQLEWRWLKTLTGVTGKYPADMWREAVAGAGGTPTNSIIENRIKYYQLVA